MEFNLEKSDNKISFILGCVKPTFCLLIIKILPTRLFSKHSIKTAFPTIPVEPVIIGFIFFNFSF